jgi:hypothetical protein
MENNMKFAEYINEAKTMEGDAKELIVELLTNFNSKQVSISNIKVARNVTFQIDWKQAKKDDWPKEYFTKQEAITSIVEEKLKRLGLIVSFDDIKVKDNKTSFGKEPGILYLQKGAKISVIVSTPAKNLISPKSIEQLTKIIDTKIANLTGKVKDASTINYLLSKFFMNHEKNYDIKKVELKDKSSEGWKTYSGTGFLLNADKKHKSNYSVLTGSSELHFTMLDFKNPNDPFVIAYIRRLLDFYNEHYVAFDGAGRATINNGYDHPEPRIYISIK